MNETALKERIKAIAKDRGVPFNEVWKQLLLERFLARLSRSEHHDRFIFKGGLVSIKDGFQFAWTGIEELTEPHMDYTGYRVSLNVKLGKMSDRIQVDIGVGDVVTPAEQHFHPFEYRGKPIFEGEISLLVYPVETIRGLGAQKQKLKLPDAITSVFDELNAWILANNLLKKTEAK
ncbi:MAG TPA: hypothetical protein DCS07_08060 [Bdellovibrionales bacterium]|nr:MAG: hypothetical protein A2Z97_08560 [Bdellovibrionales bacterium GWB1_52_6]OFZ02408.1 MAG: hypothetical protein A2X97_12725 [Bdellovibrionales bacterium GWA1_52_35]OFZ34339.1 MAG: hypothetical protein A2070_02960 [Bdellovibrionales bacterium GWC1_52_8]HAR42570.1 hypothetical protein [Bdellovibrionales bacterium]HCM41563.1 hypothetical protein [Bdellovibrionales bacterium]